MLLGIQLVSLSFRLQDFQSRRPSGLRKTTITLNSLAHRTTWLDPTSSRYCFTIGHTGVFSLTKWSSLIHTGFHVPRATRDPARLFKFSTTGLSPPLVQYSAASSNRYSPRCCPTTPKTAVLGLGCSLFARRYWGNRFCFLFLGLLRCFSSPGWLASPYRFR